MKEKNCFQSSDLEQVGESQFAPLEDGTGGTEVKWDSECESRPFTE